MHANTVLSDLSILSWIGSIVAWLSTKMIIFSLTVFSMISYFAALAMAKTSAWKTIIITSSQIAKILICMRAVWVFYVETRTSSSV